MRTITKKNKKGSVPVGTMALLIGEHVPTGWKLTGIKVPTQYKQAKLTFIQCLKLKIVRKFFGEFIDEQYYEEKK